MKITWDSIRRLIYGNPPVAESTKEERQLEHDVAEERRRLEIRRQRAERVLKDFYRADAVIRGTKGNGT